MEALPRRVLGARLVLVFLHDLVEYLLLQFPLLRVVLVSAAPLALFLLICLLVGRVIFLVCVLFAAHKLFKVENLHFVFRRTLSPGCNLVV